MFVPVEQDVGVGWNIEEILDGENRVHGHIDLAGGLGVVQDRAVLVPVASKEPSPNNRGVGYHHDTTERQKQHDGGVFITANNFITSNPQNIYTT